MADSSTLKFFLTADGLRFVDEEAARIHSSRSTVIRMALGCFPDADARPARSPRTHVVPVRLSAALTDAIRRPDATYSDVLAGALAQYTEWVAFRIRKGAK